MSERGHADHDSDERITHLHSPLGSGLHSVPYCVAGDICALTKVGSAETGDTVSAKDAPLLIDPWDMPEPLLPVAIEAASRNDEDALAKSLGKLSASDPTLRVERNAETHQLILWCMGEGRQDCGRRNSRVVCRVGREGCPGTDAERCACGIPGGGHPGHAGGRQNAQR